MLEVGDFQIGELRTDYSKFRKHTDVIKKKLVFSFFSRVYKEAKQMLNSLMLSGKTPVNLERYEIVADSLKQAESFSSNEGAFKLGVSFVDRYICSISERYLMHAKN